jgi:hypothetical protein
VANHNVEILCPRPCRWRPSAARWPWTIWAPSSDVPHYVLMHEHVFVLSEVVRKSIPENWDERQRTDDAVTRLTAWRRRECRGGVGSEFRRRRPGCRREGISAG